MHNKEVLLFMEFVMKLYVFKAMTFRLKLIILKNVFIETVLLFLTAGQENDRLIKSRLVSAFLQWYIHTFYFAPPPLPSREYNLIQKWGGG